ncbi:MAG: fluoride efflux transporter CrcB [Caldilineaceae bacterium]|nr:fluoride efflux transporter CrcB [Caldilineaceae bacterium]
MNRFLLIAIGAVLGANARYLVGLWAAHRFGMDFPYGTAIVNITGSLVLGFLVAWGSTRSGLSPELRLLFAVGFLGSYTTFSSFAVESFQQLKSVHLGSALLNIFVNNGLGLAAAWVGMVLARSVATL